MNKVNWTVVVVITIVALLVLQAVGSLIGSRGYGSWGYGGWGMMGPWMTLAPGASAGVGGWGFAPFGWIGMIFMWLIPVGFLALTVLGIVWLVKPGGNGNNPPAPTKTCPSCGRGVQSDWRNCPYCGGTLIAS